MFSLHCTRAQLIQTLAFLRDRLGEASTITALAALIMGGTAGAVWGAALATVPIVLGLVVIAITPDGSPSV